MRTLILLLVAAALLVSTDLGAQCATTRLSCSATLATALSTADCAAYDRSQYDLYEFEAVAGDVVTVEMHSTAFDTYLGLISPTGIPVMDSDDSSTSSTDSKITFQLTSSGRWTIFANSLAAERTGEYNLILTCASSSVPAGPRKRAVRGGS